MLLNRHRTKWAMGKATIKNLTVLISIAYRMSRIFTHTHLHLVATYVQA